MNEWVTCHQGPFGWSVALAYLVPGQENSHNEFNETSWLPCIWFSFKCWLRPTVSGERQWNSLLFTDPGADFDFVPAAAAKSLQSCPTLWDATDGSPPTVFFFFSTNSLKLTICSSPFFMALSAAFVLITQELSAMYSKGFQNSSSGNFHELDRDAANINLDDYGHFLLPL